LDLVGATLDRAEALTRAATREREAFKDLLVGALEHDRDPAVGEAITGLQRCSRIQGELAGLRWALNELRTHLREAGPVEDLDQESMDGPGAPARNAEYLRNRLDVLEEQIEGSQLHREGRLPSAGVGRGPSMGVGDV
jgi:hypothetical protein